MTLNESQGSGELEDWGMKVETNVARKTCAGMNKGAGGAAGKMEHSMMDGAQDVARGWSEVCVSGAKPLSDSTT